MKSIEELEGLKAILQEKIKMIDQAIKIIREISGESKTAPDQVEDKEKKREYHRRWYQKHRAKKPKRDSEEENNPEKKTPRKSTFDSDFI